MAARRPSWLHLVVAALACAGAIAWWHQHDARTSSPAEAVAPADAPLPAPDSPAPPPADPAATTTAAAPPPPVSAGAPAGCPEDDDLDPPGFVRPAVWELLGWRTQELRDRLPQLSRDASPTLRDGLNGLNQEDPTAAIDALTNAPDRHRDGFDIATAALLHLGMRALGERRTGDARHHARAALREAPDDPMTHALMSLVAQQLDDSETARREMARAYVLAPDEPALALAHARNASDHGDLDDALTAADAYVAALPEDRRIAHWRDRVRARRELTGDNAVREVDGVRVSHPRTIGDARVDALIDALRAGMNEVARMTGRARRAELSVLVYPDRDAMRRATCAPSWSGGIFDGVMHLDVPTVLGDRFARVARHEAAHAQLALVRGRVPHWLNEGLAQHVEGPPPARAIDAWRRMTRDRFWIPFASLEGELVVIDDARDAELAYHQSLAMVRLLVDERGDAGVAEAVGLIERGEPEDLLDRVVSRRTVDGEALLSFLRE